jgi:hypothetical protein
VPPGAATRPVIPASKPGPPPPAPAPPSAPPSGPGSGPGSAPGGPGHPGAAGQHWAKRIARATRSRTALIALAAAVVIAVTVIIAAVATAPAPPSASPAPPPPGPAAGLGRAAFAPATADLKLAFSTDFPGTALDTATWDQCYPWSPKPPGCTNFGNADEREWYLPSQVHVDNGQLALAAQRTPTQGADENGNPKAYTCRSGMVTTYHSVHFQYGVVQVTARLPFGKGLWPAIWLIPADGSWPPEIDIVEHWDTQPTARATLHYGKQNTQQRGIVTFPQPDDGWHTYTLYWTQNRITVYYDDTLALTTTANIPHQPMYLLLDLANENNAPGSCTGTMYVKSVNIWEQPTPS